MIDFLQGIVTLISDFVSIMISTANNIDTIEFETTAFADWLGYARYVMGDPLYIMFTTSVLISIGVTMWVYLLKGIEMIKSLLPW